MIKKILIGLSLLIGSTALAQENASSPYSFYGIGNIKPVETNEYKAMGGVGIYSDSIHLNLKNPASYSKLRFTTFTIGATDKLTKFIGDNNNSKITNKSSIDYMAIGLPIGKLGSSFGVLPYSNKEYLVNSEVTIGDQKRSKEFKGTGGLNSAFAGISYSILPNLQIGANLTYAFGKTTQSSTIFITDDGTGYPIPKGSRERIETSYSGLSFSTGIIYTKKFKGYDWHNSFSYSPENKLKGDSNVFLETVRMTPSNQAVANESIEKEKNNVTEIIPSTFTIGTGFGKEQNWFVGVELTQKQTSKLNNNLNNSQKASFENSNKISIGGYYIPKYNSLTNYFDRIVYRGGFRYENTGLIINKQPINDKAISIGAGFPLSHKLTNINVNLEFGQKGINTSSLIKENYINLSVGLSLNDLWFNVRRFE